MSLHRWLAIHVPETCIEMAREAGTRTADYILAHRIPAFARALAGAPGKAGQRHVDEGNPIARLDLHWLWHICAEERLGLHH